MPTKKPADDDSLKRLGGGRWQTRDERFTIEPQSGTWVVVDAEQTDDLGLALVRGPFPSLTAAKAAIATARTSEPATSPLAGRLAKGSNDRPKADAEPKAAGSKRAGSKRVRSGDSERDRSPGPEPSSAEAARPKAPPRKTAEPPAEPSWIADLAAAQRGRARRLVATLSEAGIADAEGIVRRDLLGDVAAIASVAVGRAIDALGGDASPDQVAAVLAEGRDDALDVRWRLVDGNGRPIVVERPASRRRR
ncbi:MAG TPA: hypothetical protein VFI34_06495 [Candidatus Limnocylindrales bacterium]|nr:hypothetical protein [Candidatus Limnocylindrales bacterium]